MIDRPFISVLVSGSCVVPLFCATVLRHCVELTSPADRGDVILMSDPDLKLNAQELALLTAEGIEDEGDDETVVEFAPPVAKGAVYQLGRGSSYEVAIAAANAADDRKGEDIALLEVTEVSYLADYFLIVTGFSRAQIRAIADAIEMKLKTEFDRRPQNTAGYGDGGWVLHDYGDVVVHVMMPTEREYYNLEAFWGHSRRLEFRPLPATESSNTAG